MIRIEVAAAPARFEERVRLPGLRAIAELVGEDSGRKRRGRVRARLAERREDLPAGSFPAFWNRILDDLETAYFGICAYCCLFIEPGTGSRTVDHMIPKSRDWQRVYEWSNYRLACGLMNSRKGDSSDVLDPFEVEAGWFALELVGFQVIPGPLASGAVLERVEKTIARLKLDRWSPVSRQMKLYYDGYFSVPFSWEYLRSRAPFLAAEMRRQGRLRDEDLARLATGDRFDGRSRL